MSFFDDNFPGVRKMLLEQKPLPEDSEFPWQVEVMHFGNWTGMSMHKTQEEAQEFYDSLQEVSAPWVRGALRVVYKGE